jgi:hypothetical protein
MSSYRYTLILSCHFGSGIDLINNNTSYLKFITKRNDKQQQVSYSKRAPRDRCIKLELKFVLERPKAVARSLLNESLGKP